MVLLVRRRKHQHGIKLSAKRLAFELILHWGEETGPQQSLNNATDASFPYASTL